MKYKHLTIEERYHIPKIRKLLKNKEAKILFAIPKKSLSKSAFAYIMKNKENINYEIIEMK